jgi:undecaprenyl-diphosphatase
MPLWHIILLAIIQGLAELLPVSSSAHVIVAEKLLGYHADAPEMMLLLVMLHTGTMFAVIVYFWKQWKQAYFSSKAAFIEFAKLVVLATVLTAVVGYPIKVGIEHMLGRGQAKAEIEEIFDRLNWIAPALAVAGILILISSLKVRPKAGGAEGGKNPTLAEAATMGAVQGLCLPFRGLSRSGATISAGMLAGAAKIRAEVFSFAMAVVITPAVVKHELGRFIQAQHAAGEHVLSLSLFGPSMLGLVFSFLAGLVALKWLSKWLESGKWYYFGVYCLAASVVVMVLYHQGY